MWIKTEYSNGALFNLNNLSEIGVAKSDKYNCYVVVARLPGLQKPIVMDEYELKRTAQSAVDLIYEAIKDGDEYFDFPADGDPRLSYSDGIIHGGGELSFRKVRK